MKLRLFLLVSHKTERHGGRSLQAVGNALRGVPRPVGNALRGVPLALFAALIASFLCCSPARADDDPKYDIVMPDGGKELPTKVIRQEEGDLPTIWVAHEGYKPLREVPKPGKPLVESGAPALRFLEECVHVFNY